MTVILNDGSSNLEAHLAPASLVVNVPPSLQDPERLQHQLHFASIPFSNPVTNHPFPCPGGNCKLTLWTYTLSEHWQHTHKGEEKTDRVASIPNACHNILCLGQSHDRYQGMLMEVLEWEKKRRKGTKNELRRLRGEKVLRGGSRRGRGRGITMGMGLRGAVSVREGTEKPKEDDGAGGSGL
ncbi:hypothetical protein BT69DRAFT_1279356 [Atractiella rhizophila]|nr:hypothetical protein BT69DRAFT_1279356 [Atractiella rhizophila]